MSKKDIPRKVKDCYCLLSRTRIYYLHQATNTRQRKGKTMRKKIELGIRSHCIARYHAMKEVFGEVRYKDFADGIKKSYAEYDIEEEVKHALFHVGARYDFVV